MGQVLELCSSQQQLTIDKIENQSLCARIYIYNIINSFCSFLVCVEIAIKFYFARPTEAVCFHESLQSNK